MNYYAVYDAESGKMLAEGNARECQKKLGCASIHSFYSLASRSLRGINGKYRVVIKRGGEVDYPVLGKNDPLYEKYRKEKANDEKMRVPRRDYD